jgi:hypothetical protein
VSNALGESRRGAEKTSRVRERQEVQKVLRLLKRVVPASARTDLSKTFRDLNAVTMQLKTGTCLKIKEEWLSGFQMQRDISAVAQPLDPSPGREPAYLGSVIAL